MSDPLITPTSTVPPTGTQVPNVPGYTPTSSGPVSPTSSMGAALGYAAAVAQAVQLYRTIFEIARTHNWDWSAALNSGMQIAGMMFTLVHILQFSGPQAMIITGAIVGGAYLIGRYGGSDDQGFDGSLDVPLPGVSGGGGIF